MRIPLIDDLTAGPVPSGSVLLVEFTGASQWYNASLTIAAGWLRQGGKVRYFALAQSPDDIRFQLNRLGVKAEELEKDDKFRILDLYTATLGQKSKEKYAQDSLKVADLSIVFSRDIMRRPPEPDRLMINDNISTLARFNDEKAFVELSLTRALPSYKLRKTTSIGGFLRGIHSSWVYEQVEAAVDGVIDFKLEETAEGETRDLIRIRNMRNVAFKRGWHQLKLNENFEVTLEE